MRAAGGWAPTRPCQRTHECAASADQKWGHPGEKRAARVRRRPVNLLPHLETLPRTELFGAERPADRRSLSAPHHPTAPPLPVLVSSNCALIISHSLQFHYKARYKFVFSVRSRLSCPDMKQIKPDWVSVASRDVIENLLQRSMVGCEQGGGSL